MSFILKNNKAEKPTLIYFKHYISKKEGRFVYSTKQKILPKDWNKETQIPLIKRGRSDLNLIKRNLNKYSDFFEKTISNFDLNNTSITKKNLQKAFAKEFDKEKTTKAFIYFSDYATDFIEKMPNMINRKTKTKFSENTIATYSVTLQKIIEFEKDKNKRIRLDQISRELHNEFVYYFKETREFSINYTGLLIKVFKSILNKAYEERYPVNKEELSYFSVLKESVEAIALNEEELSKILNLDLSKDKSLQNIRDLFIIGAWTGLRAGDFLSLPEINIADRFIERKLEKTKNNTGKTVMIPIHPHIKQIIKKRGMPKSVDKTLFNGKIKIICKKVGLTEELNGKIFKSFPNEVTGKKHMRKVDGTYPKYLFVSSHTCRRSFATNLYKMKFPHVSIMQITGHKTESSFLKYIKVTPSEHAEMLESFWNNYYQKD